MKADVSRYRWMDGWMDRAAFTQSSFYTQTLLDGAVCTQRSAYTQKPLNAGVFTHTRSLHTDRL